MEWHEMWRVAAAYAFPSLFSPSPATTFVSCCSNALIHKPYEFGGGWVCSRFFSLGVMKVAVGSEPSRLKILAHEK